MDNDSVSDGRRYRRKSDGNVYRIVAQARSPDGSVILRAVEGPGEIGTTNDRLAVDYEFFRVGERDDGAAHAAHLDEIVAQRNLAVAQAVAAERESCAKVCDDAATWCEQNDNYLGEHEAAAARRQLRSVAQKIRARGKVTPEVESVDPLPTGSVVLDAKTAAHMADVCERAVKYIDAQSKPFIGMVALSALADMLRGKVTP